MTTTAPLTWTPSYGRGRWTVVNAYKIIKLGGIGGYRVEPLRTDGLPHLTSPMIDYADTLQGALNLADRPVCRGCGRRVTTWACQWPDPDMPCPA